MGDTTPSPTTVTSYPTRTGDTGHPTIDPTKSTSTDPSNVPTFSPISSPSKDPISYPHFTPSGHPTESPQSNSTDCVCDTLYDAVCCSGIEYSNICEAECNGFEEYDCSPNACGDCVCTKEFFPFCCGDNETYSNACNANCDGFDIDSQCVIGECKTDVTTTTSGCDNCYDLYEPWCCSKTTYSNDCVAECEGGFDVDRDCDVGECVNQSKGNSMHFVGQLVFFIVSLYHILL